jgi:hypothetical protein
MNDPTPNDSEATAAKSPFQFGVKHLLAVPIAVALFFAAHSLAGVAGVLVLVAVCLAAAAVWCRRHRDLFVLTAVILLGLAMVVLPAIDAARKGSQRHKCANNLKHIAIALHMYHEDHGSLPPAFVADESGRPMHSWRVLILPYLEEKALYDQYRFDEPWNGPNNRKLADTTLEVFNCPWDQERPSPMTSYVAVVGPSTAWPGSEPAAFSDILDGTSNTLLVVEVADSGVHWMEPRDLHVVQMAPTVNPKGGQGISSRHPGGASAVWADGGCTYLPESISGEDLEAVLTIAGGEPTDWATRGY